MTGRFTPDSGDIWAPDPSSVPSRRARRARPARREGRGPGWLAAVAYCAIGLLCLSLAGLAFVLIAPPLDAVRDRLIADVHDRTGRTLTVAGPLSVSLFPRVVVSLGGVALLPPEGMDGAATVTVPSVEAETSLWSLLSRRPQLGRLTLRQPTIDLAVDAEGRRSWDLAAAKGSPSSSRAPAGERSEPVAAPEASPQTPPKASPEAHAHARARPLAVEIVDGTLRYRDARSGASYEVGALNLGVAAESPDGAVRVAGSLAWQGEPVRLVATVSGQALRGERPAQVALQLQGAPVDATYEGTLDLEGGVSADGTLSLTRLAYRDLAIGAGSLALSVNGAVAKATLRDLEIYGGHARGRLTLDLTGSAPSAAAGLKLTGVSLQPLLKDIAGLPWIDGRGTVELALSTLGAPQKQVLETLQGQVRLAVAEGSVTGIDVDKTLRALQRGRLDRLAPRRDDRTSFSTLSGSFTINDGIARSKDLRLVSAHVQLTGEGTIELPARRIDYTLNTKIAGTDAEEPAGGAAVRIGTLELPIGIKGPLDAPEFTIKGQEGLTDAVKQIGKNLRSREVQDALKGLLGGDSDKRVKPGELIEKLLKKE